MKKDYKLGAKDKFGYMMGDFGCNMSFQLISAYLLIFIGQALGIDPIPMGIIVFIAKVFDAINDPIIGALIDKRQSHKHGKYKPWIFYGSFGVALTTTLLFLNVRALPDVAKWIYVLVMYMLWSVAYTVANVPYGSLNAALTDDAKERTSLSSLRSIGAGLAMLPIMIFVPKLIYEADKVTVKPNAFIFIALVCGIIGIIGFMMTIFMTKEKVVETKGEVKKTNYLKTLKNCFTNKAMLALCLASFAQLVFILSYSQTVPLVCQYFFRDGTMQSIANVLLMLPMVLFIPFMGKLTAKFGNKKIVALPNIIGIVALFVMLFIPYKSIPGGFWVYMILYMIGMFGGGTFTLATWSMVAECVDEQEVISGVREEASVYATYSLVRKFAQGIGAAAISFVLAFIGYKTSGFDNFNDMTAHNSAPAVANGILYLSIILPLIGFIIVFLVMQFMYKLDKQKVHDNTALLRKKHHIFDEEGNEIQLEDLDEVTPDLKE